MNDLKFAEYKEGDEKHIIELFSRCFPGRSMAKDYWVWRFLCNPLEEIHILLAWDRDKLVSHYAVSPVTVSVFGADYRTALSMTTMTHTDYRGRGLFPKMAYQLYSRIKADNYFAVWGFPNDFSHRGFINHLGWRDIYEIPMMILELDEMRSDKEIGNVERIFDVDESFDILWTKVNKTDRILVKRNSKYIDWRFQKNCRINYEILGYRFAGDLLGYVITSIYNEDEIQIVDMLTVPEKEVYLNLIQATMTLAKERDMKRIKIWMPVHEAIHHELERLGFRNGIPVTYFGAKLLKDKVKIHFHDRQNWYYTMSDSDNF